MSKRTSNFSEPETNSLIELMSLYKNTIESKENSFNAHKRRNDCWTTIAQKLSASFPDRAKRDAIQVKKVWKRLKQETKKVVAMNKWERNLTGGGKAPQPLCDKYIRVKDIIAEDFVTLTCAGDREDDDMETSLNNNDADDSSIPDNLVSKTNDNLEGKSTAPTACVSKPYKKSQDAKNTKAEDSHAFFQQMLADGANKCSERVSKFAMLVSTQAATNACAAVTGNADDISRYIIQ